MHALIEKLRSEPFEVANRRKDLAELAGLECWTALKAILAPGESLSAEENKSRSYLLVDLAIEYLQPLDFFFDTTVFLAQDLKVPYSDIEQHILQKLRLVKKWRLEADLLYKLYSYFHNHTCKTKSLTRACFLLEKNGYFGVDLPNYYETLLRLEPTSKEALRFFKVYFLQEGKYKEAKRVIEKLIQTLESPIAKATETHELCGVLLHKLNQAEEALEVLDAMPEASTLDSSGLKYDCYVSLNSFGEAEKILLEAIAQVPEDRPQEKLNLRRRLLGLYDLSGNHQSARKVAEHLVDEDSLEMKAYEYLVHRALEEKSWSRVQTLLGSVRSGLGTARKKRQMELTLRRLQDAAL